MSVISDMGVWLGKGGTPSFLTTLLTFEYQVTKPLSADSRFWRSLGETNSPPSSSFTLQYRVTKPVSLAKDFWRPKGKIPFWGDKSQHDCKHGQVRCKSDRWYPNDYTSHTEETMQKYYFFILFSLLLSFFDVGLDLNRHGVSGGISMMWIPFDIRCRHFHHCILQNSITLIHSLAQQSTSLSL